MLNVVMELQNYLLNKIIYLIMNHWTFSLLDMITPCKALHYEDVYRLHFHQSL